MDRPKKIHDGNDRRFKLTATHLERARQFRDLGYTWRWIAAKFEVSVSALIRATKAAK